MAIDMDPDPDTWLTSRAKGILTAKGYSLGVRLAHGAYGHVYKGTLQEGMRAAPRTVAAKVLDLGQCDDKFKSTFLSRELMVLVRIRHRFMIDIYDIFRIADHIYIFMEFAPNGTLANFCKSYGPLSENQCGIWFNQLADAIYCLHDEFAISHRDLKLENILLDGNNCVKVTDFGFARTTLDTIGRVIPSKTFCGTRPYYAPEIAQRIPYNPLPADIWAMGVLLYTMATNKFPFHFPVPNLATFTLEDMVAEQRAGAHREKEVFKRLNGPMQALINRMFTFDASNRPNIYSIVEDPFLKSHPFARAKNSSLSVQSSSLPFHSNKSIKSAASQAGSQQGSNVVSDANQRMIIYKSIGSSGTGVKEKFLRKIQ